ncbi:sulfite exporter TauE/SafE family protein [Wohlfahrtiimonas chitiniclastica]|uniref:sulfite exporter TauE/SafE family protein n=1 Tax=Wohlfahrtiimonas chitiniclastica TaxID=400946 RepID=UPI001BCB5C27|nr:sulfite exporter TauE/SafE family protein [Wohlfahrtiimonas chitiniclastica]MBS7834298.1 sulfite exporter TauE/SafE family protein [Wohlfahrtiimonas chitiniclastica]
MGIFLIFMCIGAVVGVIAGLLGVGGGSIIVPIMSYFAEQQQMDSSIIMKIALGTSFAIIIVSSAASAWSHNKRGSILWDKVPYLGIGAAIGVVLGSLVVSRLSNTFLQIVFCFFLVYTIYSMLAPKKKTDDNRPAPNHSMILFLGLGLLIGFLASFIGIAGGAIAVPLLTYLGYEMRRAIATSSTLGVILAFFGAVSYIYTGWDHPHLPEYSLGFVYLPAFFGIAIVSLLTASIGVKLSYKLPVPRIRQIFAIFLALILVRMLSAFLF